MSSYIGHEGARSFAVILWIKFRKWAIPSLFSLIFFLSMQLIVYVTFVSDWIRTADVWCPLYQLPF